MPIPALTISELLGRARELTARSSSSAASPGSTWRSRPPRRWRPCRSRSRTSASSCRHSADPERRAAGRAGAPARRRPERRRARRSRRRPAHRRVRDDREHDLARRAGDAPRPAPARCRTRATTRTPCPRSSTNSCATSRSCRSRSCGWPATTSRSPARRSAAGDIVACSLSAANRDAAVFPDPHAIDPGTCGVSARRVRLRRSSLHRRRAGADGAAHDLSGAGPAVPQDAARRRTGARSRSAASRSCTDSTRCRSCSTDVLRLLHSARKHVRTARWLERDVRAAPDCRTSSALAVQLRPC